MTKRALFLVLALLFVAGLGQAQDTVTVASYQISVPQGDTKEYIDKTSYRGVGFDIRKFVGGNERLSVGGGVTWTVYDSGAIPDTISIRDSACSIW